MHPSAQDFSNAALTWKLTQDHLPNGGDFVVHRGGAVTLEGTEDCAVRNCSFLELQVHDDSKERKYRMDQRGRL